MRFPIRPGKAACAGLVAIFMVLPNSIWKSADARVASMPKRALESIRKGRLSDVARLKLGEVPR